MKRKVVSSLFFVCVLLITFTFLLLAQEEGDKQKEICIQHLKEIGKAIQKYKENNGDIPNWLSDLFPKYLQESNILLCPADTSEPKGSRNRTGSHIAPYTQDPKMPCSYIYEFSPLKGGMSRDRTWKEWKTSQMGEFGDKVPIVRCWWHDNRALNLSFGGELYESSINWEFEMRASKRVKLEHKISEGDKLNHKLDGENYTWISGVISPLVQLLQEFEGNITIEVISVDEEAGTIEIKLSERQTVTDKPLIGEEAQTQTIEMPATTYKLTKSGHIIRSDIGEFQPSMANLLGAPWISYILRQTSPLMTLPDQEVGISDTWTGETSIKSLDGGELKFSSRFMLLGFTNIDDRPCAVIRNESSLPISIKLPDVSGFMAEGSCNLRVVSYFDYEAGREVWSRASLDIQVTTEANIDGRKTTTILTHATAKTKLQ